MTIKYLLPLKAAQQTPMLLPTGIVAAKISDGIDALASDQTFTGTTDGVAPAISAAKTLDSDNDGQIDQILVTLSEDITDGSSTLNNTTFTVAGYVVSNTTLDPLLMITKYSLLLTKVDHRIQMLLLMLH